MRSVPCGHIAVQLLALVAMAWATQSAAATLTWSTGKADLKLDSQASQPCTLLVHPSSGVRQYDEVRLVWVGNGMLRICPVENPRPITRDVAGEPPSAEEQAAAASELYTFASKHSTSYAYVVTILRGDTFTLAGIEINRGHAAAFPLTSLPHATINGGIASPDWPIPLAAVAAAHGDSVIYHISGLGLNRATRITCVPTHFNPDYSRSVTKTKTPAW